MKSFGDFVFWPSSAFLLSSLESFRSLPFSTQLQQQPQQQQRFTHSAPFQKRSFAKRNPRGIGSIASSFVSFPSTSRSSGFSTTTSPFDLLLLRRTDGLVDALSSTRDSISSPSISSLPRRRTLMTYVQGQTHEKRREYFYFVDHQGQLFLDDARIKNFTSCFKDKEFLLFFFQRLKLNETGNYEEEFPYLSPCGRERNYVRCDDVPIVFTHFIHVDDDPPPEMQRLSWGGAGDDPPRETQRLSWGGAGDALTTPFDPRRVCMLPSTGRVYHPTTASAPSVTTTSSATGSGSTTSSATGSSTSSTGSATVLSSTSSTGSVPSSDLPPLGLIKSSLALELSKYFEFESGEENPPTHFNWMGRRHELTNELVDEAERYSKGEEE